MNLKSRTMGSNGKIPWKWHLTKEEVDMKSILKTAFGLAIFLSSSIVTSTCQGATPPPGKQFFGKVKSNEYVVTQEVDKAFTDWLTSRSNLEIGGDTTSSREKGVAIGIPAILNRGKDGVTPLFSSALVFSYWRNDYIGDVFADRESVALGDSAYAGNPVSVAIGDQARVGKLHTDSDQMFGVKFDRMEVTTTISNDVTTVTTNIIRNAYTNYYDIAKYERLPSAGDWKKTVSGTPTEEGGTTNITDIYEQ